MRTAPADAGAATEGPGKSRPLRSVRLTWTIIACYVAIGLAVLPFASRPGPQLSGMVPFFATGVLVTELSTSFLLFKHFAETRALSVLILGCAYLYSGLMAIAHLLTFPGAVLAGERVIGTQDQSTAWIFVAWVTGYALLSLMGVVAATHFSDRGVAAETPGRLIAVTSGCVLAVVLILVLVGATVADKLPPLMHGSNWSGLNIALNYLTVGMLAVSVGLVLQKLKNTQELFLWLAFALTAVAVANVLAAVGGGRYTIGWSVGRLSWVVSASVLFLYFMRQYARQQELLGVANKQLEQRVAERTAELRRSLEERSLLPREVYHRVKNNLQLVDSLLGFQASRLGPGEASNGLHEVRWRVNALGLVHQQLMQSTDLSTVDLGAFLEQLIQNLTAASSQQSTIRLKRADAEPLLVTIDFAVPLGLLTAELLSQALKQGNTQHIIEVCLQRTSSEMLTLTISDDAPASAVPSDPADERMVKALVAQLNASLAASQGGETTLSVALPAGGRQ